MVWLRLVHIVAGVVWVGSAAFVALFVLPTARTAGTEGARFVGRLTQRMGPFLGLAMLLTVVPGFMMYGRLSAGFNRAWVTSRPGLALAAGAALSLIAVLVGVLMNRPAGVKMAALRGNVETQGGVPSATQAAELARLESRVERGARLVAVLLVLAVAAMATAHYL